MSTTRLELTPGSDLRTLTTSRGSIEVWQPAAGVVCSRCRGHAPVGFSETLTHRLDALIKLGMHPVVFDDWEELASYDPLTRVHVTAWTAANADKLSGIHVLLKSKLVAMGVTVANVTLRGSVKAYTSRAEFEAALADTVARVQAHRAGARHAGSGLGDEI
jgi:hypothetical protein